MEKPRPNALAIDTGHIDLSTFPFVGEPREITLQQYEPRDVFPGMIPYTRRRVGDRWRIFFRNSFGQKVGVVECDDATAAIIKPGDSVTFDFSGAE